jgi:hypothetical protein
MFQQAGIRIPINSIYIIYLAMAAADERGAGIRFFLQACVFPRCVQSPEDAVYCAKFIKLLHAKKTPELSTMMVYNSILKRCSFLCPGARERETEHSLPRPPSLPIFSRCAQAGGAASCARDLARRACACMCSQAEQPSGALSVALSTFLRIQLMHMRR